MQNYCTLFDSNYATRGLSLYKSLKDTNAEFILYVLCMDERIYEKLVELNLERLTPIPLDSFLNQDLDRIRVERSRAEFCWTCTPYLVDYVLREFGVLQVTYLDADIMFFKSPISLHQEFEISGKSVLITEHRFHPVLNEKYSKRYGKYCVQFMTFRNDLSAGKVIKRWKEQCLESCCAKPQEGLLGDQKYLDNWAEVYECVHVLNHIGGGVAPWNVMQYCVSDGPSVNGVEVVFYHYQNLRIFENGEYDGTVMPISSSVKNIVYKPYFENVSHARQLLSVSGNTWECGISKTYWDWHRMGSKMKQSILMHLCRPNRVLNRLAKFIA